MYLLCLCVCLSIKSHLTSGASVCRENAVTYSAGNEVQTVCGIFSETAPLYRLGIPSLGWPYTRSTIFPVDNKHAQFFQGLLCDAPCHKLSFHSSFTMIILGLESSS